MIPQLIMPEEKKILDKILPKDYVDLDNVWLWIDSKNNEIVASDGLVILSLKIPEMEWQPMLYQFIKWNDVEIPEPIDTIRIGAMRARMMNMWGINIRTKSNVPTWLDIISNEGKITVYDFQLWGRSPYLKEIPPQENLFWDDVSSRMVATKAKIMFDQIIIAIWSEYYQVSHDVTSATGTTKNGYQFHLMMRTPLSS